MRPKHLTVAMGVAALCFGLLFSGCVLYPKGEESGGFPQKVRDVFLSNGVPFFKAPSEIVGLNLDPDYSDYTSSKKTLLLSYTGAERGNFDYYLSYLVDILGYYTVDTSQKTYDCYAWNEGAIGIELGFADYRLLVQEGISISFIPAYTLYLLIKKY
jgi:hypothetical protein